MDPGRQLERHRRRRKPSSWRAAFATRSWVQQVLWALALMSTVVLLGGLVLWGLTDQDFSLAETLYFAIITVSTVGFAELPALGQYPGAHAAVAMIILFGLGTVAFFNSTLTAILVEDRLGEAFRSGRMQKQLGKLTGHIIVAGCGRTGIVCAEELFALGRPFVVIDKNQEHLERVSHERFKDRLLFVAGDATEDRCLVAAGVEHASGLVAALNEDRDNVFVVLSARTLNPKIRIVAKSQSVENAPKLTKAGADRLVSPHQIGGFRLVSELVRPKTMEFLDGIHAMSKSDLHMEDVELPLGSALAGKTLRSATAGGDAKALVVAVREADGRFVHGPGPDYPLSAGCHLIVVGDQFGVSRLRNLAEAAGPRRDAPAQ